jgi:hypothetical protein
MRRQCRAKARGYRTRTGFESIIELANSVRSGTLTPESAMALRRTDFSASESHGFEDTLIAEFRLLVGLSPGAGIRLRWWTMRLPPDTHSDASSPCHHSRERFGIIDAAILADG